MALSLVAPEFLIERDDEKCITCQVCVRQCANDAHIYDAEDDKVYADSSKCVGCHRCCTLCPTGALNIKKNPLHFKENANWTSSVQTNIYILVGVVDKGTGKKARLKEYRIAGKTGTAQVAGRGGYLRGKFVASFVGYLPADNPKIAILVVVDEPQGNYYGGTVAAPVFRRVAEQVMTYLKMKGAN